MWRCFPCCGEFWKKSRERVELFVRNFNLDPTSRVVVSAAHQAAEEARNQDGKGNNGIYCGAAIQLKDGVIVTGSNSPLMHAASSLILHAAKHLAEIPGKIKLLPPNITDSISRFKQEVLGEKAVSLDLQETLIALSISATTNPAAQLALV